MFCYLPQFNHDYHYGTVGAVAIDKEGIDKIIVNKELEIIKEEITKRGQIFGLIKLSDTLFKGTPKSILIIRKNDDKTKTIEDFLLVDLPSFNDLVDFNITINQIDTWFSKREEDL